VTGGARLPLYEVVNTFTEGVNPDFDGALPAYKLDPGILADLLTMHGAPIYAHGSGNTLTTSGAPHGCVAAVSSAKGYRPRQEW
jgi:hypothetical protein